MPIARLAKAKQRLQQAVDRSRSKQVPSTHNVGHALKRVIDHHREMVACRQIAPAEDNVAPNLRGRRMLGGDGALANFDPAETRRPGVDRAPHVEAECSLVAAGEAVACFCRRERAAGSWIERRAVRIVPACGSARNLCTAAEARIHQASLVEAGEGRCIIVAVLALSAWRGKLKPEPGEVVDNRGFELRLAAGAV